MSKALFATHLCWLLIALLAYLAGTKRNASPTANGEHSSDEQADKQSQGQGEGIHDSPDAKAPRSGVPKAKRDTVGHDYEELRTAGATLLAPFENYQEGDTPFTEFDQMDPKARANAIRGLLLSPIGAHDDFPDKLISILAQHKFSAVDRETLDGIFAFIIADQFTDKTPMNAEAIRRLHNGRHIP